MMMMRHCILQFLGTAEQQGRVHTGYPYPYPYPYLRLPYRDTYLPYLV